MLSPNFHSDINKPFGVLKVPTLWPFLENSVQKCLKPIYAVSICQTYSRHIKENHLCHICIFYIVFTLSFNQEITKIFCFACFHWLLLWSIGTKKILTPLMCLDLNHLFVFDNKWVVYYIVLSLIWRRNNTKENLVYECG